MQVRSPGSCSIRSDLSRIEARPSPRWTPDATPRCPIRSACAAADAIGASRDASLEAQSRSARPASSSGCARYGPGNLAAEARRREDLARVREPVRVEGAAHALHRREVGLGEHQRHRARLVGADRRARPSASRPRRRRSRGSRCATRSASSASPGTACVVEHERMQVAVARVEDVADPQAVLALELGDPPQHLRQLRPRHDAVLDVVARRDAPHRGERGLAALPDERPLGGASTRRAAPRRRSRGRSPRPPRRRPRPAPRRRRARRSAARRRSG